MPKRFRELPEEERAFRSITEDESDESLLYCPACHRAMKQGDCVVVGEDITAKVRCAYGDCMLNAYIAAEHLQPWDAYRAEHEEDTAEWPEIPTPGECYKPPERTRRPESGDREKGTMTTRSSIVTLLLLALLALGLLTGCGVDELTSPDTTESPPDDPRLAAVVDKVQPSVVEVRASDGGGLVQGIGVGTGVILQADGLIVTNNHVITKGQTGDGEPAESIEVELQGGETRAAQVVGRDPSRDLAFLDVEGTDLTPATMVDSLDEVQEGDFIVAFGAASVLDDPITTGQVVSILQGVRSPVLPGISTLISSSAPLAQGNSGGPLADEQGRVIGINTAIALDQEGGSGALGSSFSIPATIVLETMEEVLD